MRGWDVRNKAAKKQWSGVKLSEKKVIRPQIGSSHLWTSKYLPTPPNLRRRDILVGLCIIDFMAMVTKQVKLTNLPYAVKSESLLFISQIAPENDSTLYFAII